MKKELIKKMLAAGADGAAVLPVSSIPFHPELRDLCQSNQCGGYGKNWSCPPDVGPVEELIDHAKTFSDILVFQTISTLADSFDYEGMEQGLAHHKKVSRRGTAVMKKALGPSFLHLSAGACDLCTPCARQEEKPCPHPDEKIVSLEAYGIFVSELAKAANLNYINGINTVTYFGAYLFKE